MGLSIAPEVEVLHQGCIGGRYNLRPLESNFVLRSLNPAGCGGCQ